MLRRVDYPFVCLTATLPPAAELELKQLLYFTALEVLRASSDRPNLQYCVQHLPAPSAFARREYSKNERLVRKTVTICREALGRWRKDAVTADSVIRGIYFVRTKAIGARFAEVLEGQFYYAGLDPPQRSQILTV